ncbi:MAG: hypothetical protein Q9205_004580 [Flavoplaca limonia]
MSWRVDPLARELPKCGGLMVTRALWKTRTLTNIAKITSKDKRLYAKVDLVASINVLQSLVLRVLQRCQATPGPTTATVPTRTYLHEGLY